MREDQIATSLPYKVVKGVVIWYNMDNKACREGHYNKNKGEQDLASAIEIKKKNRRNVFQIIYDERKISKSEIAKRLELSMPTIAQNLSGLFDKKLIYVDGTFDSTGGRKAQAIAFNAGARYSIGIDITKNHISGVLINLYGEIIYSVRLRFRFQSKDSYYSELKNLVEHVIEKGGVDENSVLGVGISIPAIVEKDNKTVSYIPIIEELATIYDDLRGYLSLPYGIFNDSNCGGYAELWHQKQVKNMFYLSLSNSVGGAVLLDNEVYNGESRHSGEIGHTTLEVNGRLCYCGKRGCVDAYCNAQNLSNLTDGDLKRFFELVDAGDEECTAAWEEYLYYLAVVVNNLNNILDCDIILGGYVGGYMEKYMDKLRRLVVERSTFKTDASFIRTCYFTHEAAAVGAALYFVDEFINGI